MAHQHLHFKDCPGHAHTHGKQVGLSLALLGTLAGGVLLINSGLAKYIYGADSFSAEFLGMMAAILLGAPIVIHAIKSLIHKEFVYGEPQWKFMRTARNRRKQWRTPAAST